MNTGQRYIDHLSMIVKRALEGKMGPFNFLIILGFFSTLVLLYISLHVHLDGISKRIEEEARLRKSLKDERICLMSTRNRLASAERIIPLAEAAGYAAGSAGPDTQDRVLRPE